MGLLDLLVGDLLEVDAHLEEDDLQVEELLEVHNLLGMGTVDIDGVELHILDVGAGLHREVWLQAVIHNSYAMSLPCNKSTSEKMQYSICITINRAEQRMHCNNHKSNNPYYIAGSFFIGFYVHRIMYRHFNNVIM